MQAEPSFDIGKASCQEYVSGREESGSGTELRIPVSLIENSDIQMNHIYFREKQVDAIVNTVNGENVIVVRIPNTASKSPEAIDLNLGKDEAVVSYSENGKLKYAKVSDIKQKQPQIYKGAPKN
ncbi:MAG TPA: hypothetical protein DCG42_14460 [Maribacter sp.]|uniref:hypothetical protein n=1 Tax=Maribacter sp. UBA6511 TaxID=1946805 RepID=UPI000EDE64BB|nr:hypothetical protein [Maribacter sp. UBA6511]HAF78514.1 hypothetical protein [Maribacter sp.]